MVERQMRGAIKMIGDLWYTAWVDAGQPDLQKLIHYKPTEEELQVVNSSTPTSSHRPSISQLIIPRFEDLSNELDSFGFNLNADRSSSQASFPRPSSIFGFKSKDSDGEKYRRFESKCIGIILNWKTVVVKDYSTVQHVIKLLTRRLKTYVDVGCRFQCVQRSGCYWQAWID